MDKHLQGLMSMNAYDVTEDDILVALDQELQNGISQNTVKKYRQIVTKVLYHIKFIP